MTERTETQKLMQEPVKVILGGKEYEIKPLPVRLSLSWTKEVVDLIKTLPQYVSIKADNAEAFENAFTTIMVSSPQKIIDLFFRYARDLNREEIEDTASSAEIMAAFQVVLNLERPLWGSLALTAKALSQ